MKMKIEKGYRLQATDWRQGGGGLLWEVSGCLQRTTNSLQLMIIRRSAMTSNLLLTASRFLTSFRKSL